VIDASTARAHLERLRGLGVGYQQAAKLSGVSRSSVSAIRSGRAVRVRPETEAAILAVRPVLARGALVNSYATRRLVRALEAEGFTKIEIVRRLGLRGRTLRVENRITVRKALKMRALWAQVSE